MDLRSSTRPVSPCFITCLRLTVALVWLYQGLWLKMIAKDAHHLAIVSSVGFSSPETAMLLIGLGETLLGLGVLSGLFHRFVAVFQILLLLAMNLSGIFFGGGNVAAPFGLLLGNLPLVMCAAAIGLYGPGCFAKRLPRAR